MDAFNFAKTTPTWMDQSFFDKVIRHMEKDEQAQVEEFSVKAGSNPGDNFASSLFRASITYMSKFTQNKPKLISLIIKTEMMQPLESMVDFFKDSPLFRNEMEMYGKVLPEIKSLWLSVGDNEILCPRLIYQSTEPSRLIVLEDVSGQGFGLIEKPPTDFEVSKRIFRRLAKFHASTFYLQHEQKLDYSDFKMNMYQTPSMVDMVFTQGLDAFIDVVNEMEEMKKFVPNLKSFKEQFLNKALKTYSQNRNESGLNVLNHADFHIKNLLFKKNAVDEIEDFYFVDYQLSIYATPAIDLFYALYYFVSIENRLKHRNELIALYHQQFVESLKAFGYLKAPPTLIDLHVDLLRNGNLEVLVAICLSIFIYFDLSSLTPEEMDMGEGTKKAKRRIYTESPEFMEGIAKELPRFLYNGFI